jgi:hypothetical protein
MNETELRYRVDDVEVILVSDYNRVRWECTKCRHRCEHVLRAAAWIALMSWERDKCAAVCCRINRCQ